MENRKILWVLFVIAGVLFLYSSAFPMENQDEGSLEDSLLAFSSLLHPRGLGDINLGDRKAAVMFKILRDGRFEWPSRRIWEQAPSNGIVFGQHSFMIYWGFKEDRLNSILIHLPAPPHLSTQGQAYLNRGLTKKIVEGAFGPPTKITPVDVLAIAPGTGLCVDRWVLPDGVEVSIPVFRHEPFSRMYSVGIQFFSSAQQ